MKKHWKKIAIALSLVLVLVAGTMFYLFQVKEYDTADEKVDEITEEKIEVEMPDGTTITIDEEGNVVEEDEATTENTQASTETETEGDASVEESSTPADTVATASDSKDSKDQTAPVSAKKKSSTGNASGSGSESGTDSGTGKDSESESGSESNPDSGKSYDTNNNESEPRVTVVDVKERYTPALTGLQATADTRINNLIGAAKAEYQADMEADGKVDYAYYYSKYKGAAEELEARMDKAFYATIAVMAKDMQKNGLAASHTDAVINEYEARKKQRRNELMKKASGL